MIDKTKFERAKRYLKRHYKIEVPIRIYLVPHAALKNDWNQAMCGDCERKDTHYVIRIANNLSWTETLLTLAHEFSHALQAHIIGEMDHKRLFKALEDYFSKDLAEKFC